MAHGTMTFGEQNTETEAHELMSCAREYGVNFFDTAELYPISPTRETQGRTSEYLGTWLKSQKRDELVIASKVAGRSSNYPWIPANRTVPRGPEEDTRLDAASIRAAAESELRKLQTDYLDLFQLHWPDRYHCAFGRNQYKIENEVDYASFESQVEALQRLIKEGKVRHWGLSNESTFGLMAFYNTAAAMGAPLPVSIQNCFNLLHRCAEGELAEACSPRHLNVALLPWGPLCGGALTGKYLQSEGLERCRFTLWPTRYPRYNSARVHAAVEKYCKIAGEAGCTPSQLAIAYCKSRWFIPSTIVGATSVEQLEENLDGFSFNLPSAVIAAIDEVHIRNRNPALGD